ncbi:MAG: EscU/YscU/HrcU family type III secretion system export apparatus switch protein [Hyphomonadaceae bacterium]|nr:MAG: flagellar biosynthesis protein FlhB [Caulobacteraceae bacterium]MBT9445307.1 EscU/YscU/HrcU family type III secretion system export apparatus switch protein [Hyphomonadaceae bacterium]
MEQTDQDRTEEPTPFKLKRSREKGMVARGTDLGFFSTLCALAAFLIVAGAPAVDGLVQMTRSTLASRLDAASDPSAMTAAIAADWGAVTGPVMLLCATVAAVVIFFEIVQLRGLVFSTHPLKPDFSRLNPAKGLKRVFSMRMLKELAKSLLKFAAYGAAAAFALQATLRLHRHGLASADAIAQAFQAAGYRLLFLFILVALAVALLDQVLARREFLKQMRMSRSELKREARDREGEPRIKQRRKQLHAQFSKQTRELEGLAGADMLIVNPTHYAVGLAYEPARMDAPVVKARGRNRFALLLRRRAVLLSIPIVEDRTLAQALYRGAETGAPVPASTYHAVAAHYLRRRRHSFVADPHA